MLVTSVIDAQYFLPSASCIPAQGARTNVKGIVQSPCRCDQDVPCYDQCSREEDSAILQALDILLVFTCIRSLHPDPVGWGDQKLIKTTT